MPGGGAQTKLWPWIRGPRAPAFLTGLKEDAPPSRPRSAPGPSLPLAGELIAPRRAGLSTPVSPCLDLSDKPLWERLAGWRQVGGP